MRINSYKHIENNYYKHDQEMFCNTAILFCNKMKSQNFNKKISKTEKFHPKTNIKTFARKKKSKEKDRSFLTQKTPEKSN